MRWVTSRTDWELASPTFYSPIFHLDLCYNHCHKSPLIFILHHCLLSSVGDAPYCTPEQYKECADPALGERPCPGAVCWGRGGGGGAECQAHTQGFHTKLQEASDNSWIRLHLDSPVPD